MLAVCKRAEVLLVICLSFTLAPAVSFASGALQPPQTAAILLGQSTSRIALATGAEVLCDPQGDLSLEIAQHSSYGALRSDMPTSKACSGYWVRFRVEAGNLPVGGWVLQLSHLWRHADLFLVRDGVVTSEKTGTAVPPQERSLPSGMMALPLPLEAGGAQVFYLHLAGEPSRFGESRSLSATIFPLDTWLRQQRSLLFGQGTYAGIVTGLALFNLILFLTIQERVYLYYVLYVTSFGSIWIARTGFFYQYLWPHHPGWDSAYQPFLAACAIVFSVLFVREFLATRKRSPSIDLVLRGSVLLTMLVCLVWLAGVPFVLALPLALIGLAVTLIYAALGLIALLSGYRPARFFLLAWAALLVGNFIYILMFLRLLPMTFFTYNAAQAGSAMECILLAFALADRVNLLKRVTAETQLQYTHELQQQVKQRTGELSDAVERLKTASVTDPLTGLGNRRHVDTAIQPWIADLRRARIRNTPGLPRRYLALCLADLDHFKLVNDELGHAAGDRVLRAAAETLRQNVRATAILSRWGGEEFLILDHVTAPCEDLLMAERLRQSVIQQDSPVFLETGWPLSLSLGVVRYPFSDVYPELLAWDHCLALADHALYRAKKAGRNRWQCYRSNEDTLHQTVRERGAEEVRRLLRLHADEAFTLGLIQVIEQVPSGVEAV